MNLLGTVGTKPVHSGYKGIGRCEKARGAVTKLGEKTNPSRRESKNRNTKQMETDV